MTQNLSVVYGFLIPSILMGLGIAIDVAIATISRFRDQTMTFRSWTLPVTVSHVLLPAFGYYGWWFLAHSFHGLGVILGLTAFGLIFVFLYETFCGWVGLVPKISLRPLTDVALNRIDARAGGRFIMILAVSMDALWSGPAKAAQAESGGWTSMEVFASFFIAGIVVAVVAELSLLIALLLNRVDFRDANVLAGSLVMGKYVEVSVLFAFGLLSLRNSFSFWFGVGGLGESLAVSAVLCGLLWLIFWKRLKATEYREVLENLSVAHEQSEGGNPRLD